MPHDKHIFHEPEQIAPERFMSAMEKLAYWFIAFVFVCALSLMAGYAYGSAVPDFDKVEALCEQHRLSCRSVDENTIEANGVVYVRG